MLTVEQARARLERAEVRLGQALGGLDALARLTACLDHMKVQRLAWEPVKREWTAA